MQNENKTLFLSLDFLLVCSMQQNLKIGCLLPTCSFFFEKMAFATSSFSFPKHTLDEKIGQRILIYFLD